MKRKFFILAVVSLMVCLIGFVAVASACDHDRHRECKSRPGQLCLYQKCPQTPTDPRTNPNFCTPGDPGNPYQPFPANLLPPFGDEYLEPVDRPAWGKIEYRTKRKIFEFQFEGHGLEPEKSYTLIYYPEIWFDATKGLIYLGSGIANNGGNVEIGGSLDTGSLPAPYDCNNPNQYIPCNPNCNPTTGEGCGAKIWLVPSSDICLRTGLSAPQIIRWNPAEYLFEDDLITFTPKDYDPNADCSAAF